jgi:hypothetical protein
MARFDWYQVTVDAPVPDIRACLGQLVEHPVWEPQKRGKQGYGFSDHLQGPDGTAAMLWWGGTHAFPHVVLSGAESHEGAMLLRSEWPEQQAVTRVDSCIDYAEPDAYDRLQDLALTVASAERIKVGTAGDHLLTMKGRTCYLGAPSSHTRLRIYDKAEQLREVFKNDPVKLETVPQHQARFECQVRPQTSKGRYACSKASPLEVMGSARWMRKLMGLVAQVDLEPLQVGKVWRQADDQRAYTALLAQYGGLLKHVYEDAGSWECVGLQIGHDLAERAAVRGR